MVSFDPNAAAGQGAGVFGLLCRAEESEVVLIPVPFAATVSYGGGAEAGPAAILAASRQVDLQDVQTGRPWRRGIHMLEPEPRIAAAASRARALAEPIVRKGGAAPGDERAVREVDAAGQLVNELVAATTERLLREGRLPGVVGGDHSVPLGAIAVAARARGRLGILHVDAHCDLREAYEGFRWSHASIMDNVLREVPGVERLVQVGIRDVCEAELDRIRGSEGRVIAHFDSEWRRRQYCGATFDALCREAVEALPQDVWVSFDIDGLDPALCQGTGTPVPGGLQFAEACHLLECLVQTGRRIVGFDLCEVAPGGSEWDANVGARMLYKLCGFALLGR